MNKLLTTPAGTRVCIRGFLLSILAIACASVPMAGQSVRSDATGVVILSQALAASGAANPMRPVQDFSATGTITYFWAGEEVRGTATVRGRAPDHFRLDANLPEGVRSWTANRARGKLREADGRESPIPAHNTLNLGIVTFPYLSLAAALSDPLTTVSYRGLASSSGRQLHQVRVQRHFPPEVDPDGTASKLCVTDYFVDPRTGLLVKTLDMTHPNETLTEDLEREIELENYVPMERVMVPTLIREKVIGQTTWELRLSSIVFNTGLTDVDFAL